MKLLAFIIHTGVGLFVAAWLFWPAIIDSRPSVYDVGPAGTIAVFMSLWMLFFPLFLLVGVSIEVIAGFLRNYGRHHLK